MRFANCTVLTAVYCGLALPSYGSAIAADAMQTVGAELQEMCQNEGASNSASDGEKPWVLRYEEERSDGESNSGGFLAESDGWHSD